jgi:alpha-L-fucosidase 2
MRRLLATIAVMAAFLSTAEANELKNVEYGRAGDYSLRFDAHIPEGKGPHPAAILVHGGGWMRGDRAWNVEPLFAPLADAKIAWFSISYRLASDFLQIGTAVEDVHQAVRHVRANAAKYNIDPNRIALVGESAGAHLASLAALAEPKSVAAVVSLYSPNDLELLAKTSSTVPEQIRQVVAGTPFAELLLSHLRSISPIQHVRRDAPPFLLIHGTADPLVPFDQSVRMQERLRAVGADCELVAVDGGAHGIRFWDRSPAQAKYRLEMLSWLRRKLAA